MGECLVVDVVILGSGTPNPDPDRAGSAVAVVDGASWLMVDCGRAATQRALSAGLDLTRMVAVMITHHHSDHLSDLATLATTRWAAGATTPLTVVAPAGPATAFAGTCLDGFADQAFHRQAPASAGSRPSIDVAAFDASDEVTEVFDAEGWTGSGVLVDHHPVEPAVGYRIQRGRIRVVISGDTRACDGMRLLAEGADVLIHEALLSQRVSASLLEWNASARSVGELAAATQPETLIITHLIPAPTTVEDEQAYVDEVREGGFAGPTLLARDLLRLNLVSERVQ